MGWSGLALTVKTYCFRTIRNSFADSADGDLGGSGLAFTMKTYGFRTIRNSSADSADDDLGWGFRARFYCENK